MNDMPIFFVLRIQGRRVRISRIADGGLEDI
jgi:hypothetical protein